MASTTEQLDRTGRLALSQIRNVIPFQINAERFNLGAFSDILLWDGPVDYTFTDPSSARINKMSSDNALDVGQEVKIDGLTDNWQLSTQIKALDGQNKVTLDPELIRINLVTALQDLNGEVYIYEDGAITNGIPNNLNTVKGYVHPDNNISKTAVYSVPDGYVASFRVADYSTVPSSVCCLSFRGYVRSFNGSTIKSFQALIPDGGTTWISFEPKTTFPVQNKSDIFIRISNTSPGASVSVVLDWELLKV
jgi:hypothetical protein